MTDMNKKCWICKRTDEESISDFKNLVLDFDGKVEKEYIIPQKIKDVIKDDNITVVPEGADDNNFIMMRFEAFNEKNENIEIKSDHNIFTTVHICHVCDTIFRTLQRSQNNDIEDMKEAFNENIDRVISVLKEIKNE